MAAMRRVWEFGLLFTVALAVGVVVTAAVAAALLGGADAVAADAGDVASTVIPVAAGLVAVVLTLDVGLRRLNRPKAKTGW